MNRTRTSKKQPPADQAEWERSDEVVELDVKQPLDKVIPVRLAADKWAVLRREARELGIGPSTLARMWILEKLRELHSSGG
ncbi:MAG: hypothetical protein HY319_08145 [Armatimonadetes bacterium]|nr:hypothetical protein [Armatimonadota bacterium]